MPKNFDLDSTIKVGVTDIVGKPRGPRSRKEKLKEREIKSALASKDKSSNPPNTEDQMIIHQEVKAPIPPEEMPRQRLPNAYPMPTQRLGNPEEMPRQNAEEMPRQKPEKTTTRNHRFLDWQIEMFKLFLQQKSTLNEVGITYGDLALRFEKDQSSIRRNLKKFMKEGLIEKVSTGWINDTQKSIIRLNIESLNAIVANHQVSQMPRQIGTSVPRHSGRSSSNKYLISTNTFEMPRHSNIVDEIDLSKLPGVDRQKLKRYVTRYRDVESLQDFVDRVAFAIESQKGTRNEVNFPGAFIEKCYDRGVDVPATYKSRKALAEEEALKREKAELEEIQKIKEQRRQIALERTRLKFEEWLEDQSREKLAAFEKSRSTEFPENREFPTPAAIQKIRLRKIQLREYLAEVGESETYLEPIIKTYEADEQKHWR